MKKLLLCIAFVCLFAVCKQRSIGIQDFSFIEGKWNSSGTDSYEYWVPIKNGFSGVSLRVIENTLTKVDSMVLQEQSGKITMTLHLAYTKKQPATYLLKGNSINEAYFYHDTAFPNQISYRKKEGANQLIVCAGEDLKTMTKAFQFLYVPVNY